MSNKYAPLTRFLRQQEAPRITMTFQEVEEVLGFSLPASAWKYPAWWSNAASGQSQVKSWRDAGWETRDLDLRGRKVTFVRVAGEPVAPAPKGERGRAASRPAVQSPARPASAREERVGEVAVNIPASAIDMAKLPPQARRLLESRARGAGRTVQQEAAAVLAAALTEERARLVRALEETRQRTNRPGAFDLLAVMERKRAHAGD